MKLMQEHANSVNVQGQPPGKKLRTTGGYNNGDPPNYDYQVNTSISLFSSTNLSISSEIQINNKCINNNQDFSLFICI